MIQPPARILPDAATPPRDAPVKTSNDAEFSFRDQLFESLAPPSRNTAQDARADRPDRASGIRETASPRKNDTRREDAAAANPPADPPSRDAAAAAEASSQDATAQAADNPNSDTDADAESQGEPELQAPADETSDNQATEGNTAAVQAASVNAAQPQSLAAVGAAGPRNGDAALANPTAPTSQTSAEAIATQAIAAASNTAGDAGTGQDASAEGEPKTQAGTKADANAARSANANAASGFTPTAPIATADSSGNHTIQSANPANAPTPAAPSPNLGDGPDALNEARLARGLKSALNQQGGSVTLRLTPPEMGTVRIQMQLQGTQVTAQFHAETDAARSLLQQQLGQLRTALEGQGLSVDRLGVQSMSAGNASSFNGSNLQQQNQSFGQNQNDPNANPDGRSRGFFQQSRGDGDSSPREDTNPNDAFADQISDQVAGLADNPN